MGTFKQKSSNKHLILRGVLYFLGGLVILLIAAQLLVTFYADEFVGDYLKEQVRKSSNNTYEINFDNLSLNIFSGSATFDNLRVDADTIAFGPKTSPASKPPKTLFRGTIGQVAINDIDIIGATLGEELSIGSVHIVNPDIHAYQNPREIPRGSSSKFSTVDSSIYAGISSRYQILRIDEIAIQNGTMMLLESTDTLSNMDNVNITLRNIHVDSSTAASGRQFVTDDISMVFSNFTMKTAPRLNTVTLGKMALSSDENSIILDSLYLKPLYPRFEFSSHNGVEIDRIDLTAPKIIFKDVDFSRFIDSARFYARSMEINNARMEDFRNKNLPFPPNNRPPLPHMVLKNMHTKLKIDTVSVNDAFISYAEYWYKAPQAGHITFEDLNARIYNLSNYPEAIENGTNMVMDARAQVMGQGVLNTHFEFPMDTKSGFHKVSGTLGAMDMAAFNPMLEYVAFVRVDRGKLQNLKFDMTLNNTRSNGTLVMEYEGLEVSVLDKKSIEQRGIMENLKTFAANTFVLNKDNTPETGMTAGPIRFERIQRKSVFNYWWKSLLSGIKETIK